jgi:hypothetical protein
MHGDAQIFPGPDDFKADQNGRILDVTVPPIDQCQVTPRSNGGAVIVYNGEVPPLGLKLLKEHLLSWNAESRIIAAPMVSTWWLPYDLNAIMRFGHAVNTVIPEDPNEAEFPPLPWGRSSCYPCEISGFT